MNQSISESTQFPILFFDGICNLCNATVQWIIKRDPKGIIHFSSLQSDFAQKHLNSIFGDSPSLNSVILVDKDQFFVKSQVIKEVLKRISPHSPLLWILKIVPRTVQDFFYDKIARNRYLIFGKRTSCQLPVSHVKSRFIE